MRLVNKYNQPNHHSEEQERRGSLFFIMATTRNIHRRSQLLLLLILLLFFYMYPSGLAQLSSNQTRTMITVSNLVKTPAWSAASAQSPCLWKGVTCSSPGNGSIIQISLSGFGLSTSDFLPFLCQIDTLQTIDLSKNFLSSIPDGFMAGCAQIDGLKLLNFSANRLVSLPTFHGFVGLESMDFSFNRMSGNISLEFDELVGLKSLVLSFNNFSGLIPTHLGKSKVLEKLELSTNSFTGSIPEEISTYKNLILIDLSDNHLSGSIPVGMGNLPKLDVLIISNNSLGGEIPASISKIVSLQRFTAYQNNFEGPLPSGITTHLKNLDLSYNRLSGTIPPDFLTPTSLLTVDLSYNLLVGPLPERMSPSLVRLRLGSNSLSGEISSSVFANRENLMYLELENNSFMGLIPRQLGSCKSLALLNLAQNNLTGVLPLELGNLSKLQVMKLQHNNLGGEIPVEITRLTMLSTLNISWNSLGGSIPGSISNLVKLTNLNLQSNNLGGQIPDAVRDMHLLELQLGQNELSGMIPTMPPTLQIALNLSSNHFKGDIPTTLSQLSGLEVLDLSNNQFSGSVPDFLTQLVSLTQLILSNNQLSGILPKFAEHVSLHFGGNLLQNSTSASPAASTKKSKSVAVAIIISVAATVVAMGIVTLIALSIARHFYRVNDEPLHSTEVVPLPQVVQGNLLTANGFHRARIDFEKAMETVADRKNIVLKTRFSTYYKSIMPSGTSYFVKKLNWSDKIFQLGSRDKFEQELEVLGRLSNSNIMAPLAYVLSVDSAFLFYEFAPKGTLFDVLHGSMRNTLDWSSRYSIGVGVAQGLAFLHGCTSSPILLLDLSSRNIMLKSLKEPLVGDIELCKVIDPSKSTGSLSAVAGSVGYIPPEYAYTMRVTMAGNVYSFGIILLELLTGKPAVSEGTELAKWVISNSTVPHNNLDHILDFNISRTVCVRSQMLAVLKVALACVNISPEARPKIKSVLRMLLNVR